GNLFELPKRNRHRENSVPEIVTDKYLIGLFVDVTGIRKRIERVETQHAVNRNDWSGQIAIFSVHEFSFYKPPDEPDFRGHAPGVRDNYPRDNSVSIAEYPWGKFFWSVGRPGELFASPRQARARCLSVRADC